MAVAGMKLKMKPCGSAKALVVHQWEMQEQEVWEVCSPGDTSAHTSCPIVHGVLLAYQVP